MRHTTPQRRPYTTPEALGWHIILDLLQKLVSGRAKLPYGRNPKKLPLRAALSSWLTGVTLLALFVLILACGVLPAQLTTDGTVLSSHPDCGYYLPNTTSRYEAVKMNLQYEFAAEIDSAALVRNCYHAAEGADGCNLYLTQSISHTVKDNASCPFAEYMCHNGPNGAIEFATGAVDARAIGINAPQTMEFRRSTTCAPLNMNSSFIRTSADGEIYDYHYGFSSVYGNASWQTLHSQSTGGAPAYIVGYPIMIPTLFRHSAHL